MIASQLIYTACGKDKTGAFSVWAKSNDITKEEADEIVKAMNYKRPSNLPYEPTEEEVETLFPKKFAFFTLSTGRQCVAQTTYIGRVYSDLDSRTGNYIIHAYVFERNANFLPVTLFDSPVFKKKLTYQEWHDMPAPDNLPQVELEGGKATISKAEFDSFLSGGRSEQYAAMLQAVINVLNGAGTVTFNDTEENQKTWYKALALCLPKSIQANMTFSTFFTPKVGSLPNSTQDATQEIKVRNVANTLPQTIYNYQQEVRAGRYAFDFLGGQFTAVEAGKYVRDIVSSMRADFFRALGKVEAVDKLIVTKGYDIETACDVAHLLQNDITWFKTVEELNKTADLAKQAGLLNAAEYARAVYEKALRPAIYGINETVAPLYRMVYSYADASVKKEILDLYLSRMDAFGVNTSAEGVALYEQVKEKAPVPAQEIRSYLMNNHTWAMLLTNSRPNDTVSRLIYGFVVECLQNKPFTSEAHRAEFAGHLYNRALRNAVWGINGGTLPLYNFAYACGDKNVRREVFGLYIARMQEFGVKGTTRESFVADFKQKAPFEWKEFVAYLIGESAWNEILRSNGSDNMVYLVFDALCDGVSSGRYAKETESLIHSTLSKICGTALINRSIDGVRIYLKRIAALSPKHPAWLLDNALASAAGGNSYCTAFGVKFLFELIESIDDDDLQGKLLLSLLNEKATSEEFIVEYLDRLSAKSILYKKLETRLINTDAYRRFASVRDQYSFVHKKDVKKADLEEYYKKYYLAGADGRGVFVKKLYEYLRAMKNNAEEALRAYEAFFYKLNDKDFDVLKALQMIETLVYGDLKEAVRLYALKRPQELMVDINGRLQRNGIRTLGKFEVVLTAVKITLVKKNRDVKKQVEEELRSGMLFRGMVGEEQRTILLDNYAKALAETYLAIVDWKEYAPAFEAVFAPFIELGTFRTKFTEMLNGLENRDRQALIAYWMAYIFNEKTRYVAKLRKIFDTYLENLSKGEYKKLFHAVLDAIPGKLAKAVEEFTDDYIRQHQSWLERLFGGKKKEKKKEKKQQREEREDDSEEDDLT